jgi:hypothetical protein
MIRVKYENSWYGYQGRGGYALYINGKKMHSYLFISIAGLRAYWNKYRPLLIAGIIPKG